MKTNFIVLGCERESIYQLGEVVEKLWVYYFKPDHADTRLFKGYSIVKSDCLGVLDFGDFEELSGLYRVDYSIVKSQPMFKAVQFLESVAIQEVEDTILILSVKPGEFETEDGQVKKGIGLSYIDSTGYMDTSKIIGFIPSKAWCDRASINLFPHVPAYYSASVNYYKNRKGEAIVKIAEPKFVQAFQRQQTTAA